VDTLPNNLPLQLSSFIGREREIAEVKQLLDPSGTLRENPQGLPARLVTLTGAGGCGKTRLALQVGASLSGRQDHTDAHATDEGKPRPYADGIWFIELAALSDPALVAQRVAAALDVREQPSQPLLTTLINYLRDKHTLLILDNCEHLLEACAQLVDTLLRTCPRVQILATSREALNVEGERVYLTPAFTPNESTQLFVERATAANASFQLNEQNANAIAHICQRLDGIPLAIELAAARVRALSVEDLAARLNDSLALLKGGPHATLPRQQTMRATLDWSHALLSDDERVLFRRLAVFAGGWTLEAAEAVCSERLAVNSEPQLTVHRSLFTEEVLDVLTQLVNKSLVLAEEHAGTTRYRMLEPIRQYAREKLQEASEEARVRSRHLAHFTQFAETAEPQFNRRDQVAWIKRLVSDYDNLRAALAWSLEGGEIETGLRLGGAQSQLWRVKGYWSERRQPLVELLARPEAAGRTGVRAKALYSVGLLSNSQDDFAMARPMLEESVAICRELGDNRMLAAALNMLGLMLRTQDLAAARAALEESLAIGRASANKSTIAWTLNHLGTILVYQGDHAAARQCFEESITVFRASGNRWGLAMPLVNLGGTLSRQGDYATAHSLAQEGLTILREMGDKTNGAGALELLGNVARAQGNYVEAQAFLKDSLVLRREVGENLGLARLLESCANLAVAQGQAAQATRLFGAAEALRETIGATVILYRDLVAYERNVATVRTELGEATFAATWAEGRVLTMEQAIATAEQVTTNEQPTQTQTPTQTKFPAGLTEREVEVLRWLARGLTNEAIAEQLVISPRTVNAHLRAIYSKLDVTTRTAAARAAIDMKLV
jgi:predicted ATPase/DNA-binding CsgD family transcriptional regulator